MATTSQGSEQKVRRSNEPISPLQYRMRRLWAGADLARVPLRTIIVTAVVIGAVYLSYLLLYRLRDILLLFAVAGFVAVLLNPVVELVQHTLVRRRGMAVLAVTMFALLCFLGLLFAFGYPLVNAITNLANSLPHYVSSVQSGKGWLGHLATKYHIQHWVRTNAPKIATFAQDLSKPALNVGKGAISLIIEMVTIFVLVLLLLLEGPKLRRGILYVLGGKSGAEVTKIAGEVNRAVTGYMLGNFLTSLIAGGVVFVALLSTGVQYPILWALWVALVDFLPMIGGALAGIPTILFAFFSQGLTAGVVTLVVFVVYTQIENHILNPIIMSKTVRISPLLVLISVLVGADMGNWIGGLFGGFVAALLSIPAAGALQVIVREAWLLTGPPPEQAAALERPAVVAEADTIEDTVQPETGQPGVLEEDALEEDALHQGTLHQDTLERDAQVPASHPE